MCMYQFANKERSVIPIYRLPLFINSPEKLFLISSSIRSQLGQSTLVIVRFETSAKCNLFEF